MMILKVLKYLPLFAVLIAAVGIVIMCMGEGQTYENSTFVFSNQGQVRGFE